VNKFYSIVFFIVLLFTFPLQATASNRPFVLVIDPGHGGQATGAIGKQGQEKDINLAVSKLLKQYVSEKHPDVKIVMTRTRDIAVDLDERAEIANKAGANLFISIHANAMRGNSEINGCEVYTFGLSRSEENLEVAKRENSVILLEDNYEQKYEGFDPNSSESYIIFEFIQNAFVEQSVNFATIVQRQLVDYAHREDLGVKQAEFLVLRKSSMPRVLIELDYISNPDAERFMLGREGQETLARSICNAFTEYKKDFDRKTTITESNAFQPVKK